VANHEEGGSQFVGKLARGSKAERTLWSLAVDTPSRKAMMGSITTS